MNKTAKRHYLDACLRKNRESYQSGVIDNKAFTESYNLIVRAFKGDAWGDIKGVLDVMGVTDKDVATYQQKVTL